MKFQNTPLRINIFKDETLLSMLQRLCRRHQETSLSEFLRAIDFKGHRGNNPRVYSKNLSRLSELLGIDEFLIINNSFIDNSGGSFIGDIKLSNHTNYQFFINYGRVCPQCLHDDLSDARSLYMPTTHRRWYWEIGFLRSCLKHHCTLVSHCPTCDNPLSPTSLDPARCTCGASLAANEVPSGMQQCSMLDLFIIDLISSNETFPDYKVFSNMAPLEVYLLVKNVALTIASIKNSDRAKIFSLDSINENAALQSFKNWPTSFSDLLLIIRSKRLMHSRIFDIYKPLYQWTLHRKLPEYQPISDFIMKFHLEMRKKEGLTFTKRTHLPRGWISKSYAVSKYHCSRALADALAAKASGASIDVIVRQKFYSDKEISYIVQNMHYYVESKKVLGILGISYLVYNSLSQSNLLNELVTNGNSLRFAARKNVSVLQHFLSSPLDGQVSIDDMISLNELKQRSKLSFGEILFIALDHGFALARIASKLGEVQFQRHHFSDLTLRDKLFEDNPSSLINELMSEAEARDVRARIAKRSQEGNVFQMFSNDLKEAIINEANSGMSRRSAGKKFNVPLPRIAQLWAQYKK